MKTLGYYRTTDLQTHRRIAVVRISAEFLLEFCKDRGSRTLRVSGNALPDDVRAVGAAYDPMYDLWELAVTSESFAEVDPAVMPPILDSPIWHEEAKQRATRRRQS